MPETIQLNSLEVRAAQIVELAIKSGADQCDCVVARSQSLGISVLEGKLENADRAGKRRFFVTGILWKPHCQWFQLIRQMILPSFASAQLLWPKHRQKTRTLCSHQKTALLTIIQILICFDATEPDVDKMTSDAMACEAAGLDVKGVDKSMGANSGWGMTGFVTSNFKRLFGQLFFVTLYLFNGNDRGRGHFDGARL